jgi:hypothetical protein
MGRGRRACGKVMSFQAVFITDKALYQNCTLFLSDYAFSGLCYRIIITYADTGGDLYDTTGPELSV